MADPLVKRSSPGHKPTYGEYREVLRHDFFYSCAYCTLMEAEAKGISYEIDHFLPRSLRAKFLRMKGKLEDRAESIEGQIDAFLRIEARSDLIDPDENLRERRKSFKRFRESLQSKVKGD